MSGFRFDRAEVATLTKKNGLDEQSEEAGLVRLDSHPPSERWGDGKRKGRHVLRPIHSYIDVDGGLPDEKEAWIYITQCFAGGTGGAEHPSELLDRGPRTTIK
jgi:hypothetical protein